MLKEFTKAVVFVSTSAVAIPYAVAFLANLLCGWPQGQNKYRRAFSPGKVLALNYAIIQQITRIRFAKLYFDWKLFYSKADQHRLIKDIQYGTNENHLDVYLPQGRPGHPAVPGPHPVVVFVYGGAWGSGDKNMYCLLCTELADNMQAIVCCPNYSIYPRGYVDDMVQDLVDCLSWIHHNIHNFGGDKDRVMLVGHSAGAHLVTLTTLELTMKRLLHNPESLVEVEGSPLLMSGASSSIMFEDQHFDGGKGQGPEGGAVASLLMRRSLGGASENSTGSFYVVGSGNGNGTGSVESGNGRPESVGDNGNSDSFILVSDKENGGNNRESASPQKLDSVEALSDEEKKDEGTEKDDVVEKDDEGTEKEEIKDKEETLVKSVDLDVTEPLEIDIEDEANISRSQKEVRDILSSIRAVIGLAGVYDIGDHFEHESWRGIEDISAMARAMYGPENFARFSPSWIVGNLPKRTRMPPFQLVHGEQDVIVPVNSSVKFSQQVHELGGEASLTVLPECPHEEICLDLMNPARTHYDAVMGIILDTAQRYL